MVQLATDMDSLYGNGLKTKVLLYSVKTEGDFLTVAEYAEVLSEGLELNENEKGNLRKRIRRALTVWVNEGLMERREETTKRKTSIHLFGIKLSEDGKGETQHSKADRKNQGAGIVARLGNDRRRQSFRGDVGNDGKAV